MIPFIVALTWTVLAGAPIGDGAQPESQAKVPLARFQRVDDHLYRGSQPDLAGFRYLRQLGIRTVINLRSEEDALELDERRIVESLGMRYVQLPVKDGNFFTRWRTIPADTVKQFFKEIDVPEAGPVFVHCRRGADRTGALIGFYRVARSGWDGIRAYAEARQQGMRSWYSGLRRQIETFDGAPFRANPPVSAR